LKTTEFIEFFGNPKKQRGQRFRNQFYIFLACLAISIFIWTLVRLSKDYIYAVTYEVSYTNIPQNLKLIGKSDTIVKLNIKVQGFDFFSEEYFKHKHQLFDISLKNVKLISRDQQLTGYLLTTHIARELANQTGYLSEIYSVTPDTLFFIFERKNLKNITPMKPASPQLLRIKSNGDTLHDTLIGHKAKKHS
jgi:hypothetical protein